ncbi:MAG: hypothetical protein JKY14_06860 [Paraglaciecola sp.]|nr:hypothetical protein [Paraglaciecola sp.]
MTKQNEYNDQTLEQLYAKRKRQHLAPASVKREIMSKQQNNQGIAYIFRRISYVAAAASTLLLMSLLLTQQSEQVTTELHYQIVQLHTLDTKTKPLFQSIKSRYAAHYKDYLAQKKTYAAHHKTKAILHLVEQGWQLKSCDDEILQLSNELIAALSNIHQIDAQINSGDTVEIAFDQTGIILGIIRSGNYLQC